jgi:hypothetical protein
MEIPNSKTQITMKKVSGVERKVSGVRCQEGWRFQVSGVRRD